MRKIAEYGTGCVPSANGVIIFAALVTDAEGCPDFRTNCVSSVDSVIVLAALMTDGDGCPEVGTVGQ